MRSERIESDTVAEAFFSPFCHRFVTVFSCFFPSSYNSCKNTDTDLVSDNGQGIVVLMHLRHLVYVCDDFNGSWLGN